MKSWWVATQLFQYVLWGIWNSAYNFEFLCFVADTSASTLHSEFLIKGNQSLPAGGSHTAVTLQQCHATRHNWCHTECFTATVSHYKTQLVSHWVLHWNSVTLQDTTGVTLSVTLKHRKNCECCHHHSLFKGHNVIVHIVVLNCQKCNQCLKCHVSGHKNFQKLWKLPKNLKTLKNCQKLSTLSKLSKMSKIVKYYQKLPKIVQIVKKL